MKNLYIKALEKFGNDNQIDQLNEEMAELVIAINHFKRGRSDKKAILGEIIDVQIMLEQMIILFGFDENEVTLARVGKLGKLEKLLNEEAH